MKAITSAQQAWLAANRNCHRIDVLEIDLPNGQAIYAAMGGSDVIWNGNTYSATAQGVWQRGAVASAAMMEPESKQLKLTVSAMSGVVYPGTAIAMAGSFVTGAWDAAKVKVTALYFPLGQWGNVQVSMTLFAGMISAVQRTGRTKATINCQDWLYLLNIQVPRRVIQPSCFATFGDAACGFVLSGLGLANTVAAGSGPASIVPGSAWPATDARGNSISATYNGNGYFAGGKLQWTSGNNQGFYSHVAAQSGSTLTLAAAPPFPLATGDAFTAFPGCQKTLTDCTSRWGNQANHLGMPWVPPPEHAF